MLSCLSFTRLDAGRVTLLTHIFADAQVLLHELVALLDLALQADSVDLEEPNLLAEIPFDL